MNIETEFPPEWKDRVEVSASPCLGLCEADNVCHAPYVIIDGETKRCVLEIGQHHASRDYSVVGKRTGEVDADFVDCRVVVAIHQVCFSIFP